MELKLTVDGLEKERDFYFSKLRDIELICQEHESENNPVLSKIIDILYATEVCCCTCLLRFRKELPTLALISTLVQQGCLQVKTVFSAFFGRSALADCFAFTLLIVNYEKNKHKWVSDFFWLIK